MSRISKDEWILPDGTILALSQNEKPPIGARVYNGYDYVRQEWIYQGKKDTRSIEELRVVIKNNS